jgi:hypothetical protein
MVGCAQSMADLACHPPPIWRLAIARPGTVVNVVHPDISLWLAEASQNAEVILAAGKKEAPGGAGILRACCCAV